MERDRSDSRRPRIRLRDPRTRLRALAHPASPPAIDTAPSAVRAHLQVPPDEQHIERHRLRRRQEDEDLSESIDTVQRAVARLNEASSSLYSLLDEPVAGLTSPSLPSADQSGDTEAFKGRTKRRKLDSDAVDCRFKGFSYGHFGQVVPGQLKMEITSCDGGHFSEKSGSIRNYWPENVLRNDKSVYCTENDKCNIILNHQGETPFSLKKLVIKAPATGFTAPIQEGMVFVSMTCDDLLPRTALYNLRQLPPPPLHPRMLNHEDWAHYVASDPEPRSLTGRGSLYSTHPAQDLGQFRPPSRRADYPSVRAIPPPMSDWDDPIVSVYDEGNSSYNPPRPINPATVPLFNITTSCEDFSGDEEEESSVATLADRHRRDRMQMIFSSSENEEDESSRLVVNNTVGAESTRSRRCRRRLCPSKVELTAPLDAKQNETPKPQPMLAPHAKFFIEREKNMISIKFEPEV